MAIKFYDLAGKEGLRFSPYGWRARMALLHKGLEAEWIPVKFTDKDKIAFSGQGKVPIIVDGDTVVSDSFEIAAYLDKAYPDGAALFAGEWDLETTRAWNDQVTKATLPALAKIIVGDVFEAIEPCDQDYFRETREKAFGKTMEQLKGEGDQHRDGLFAAFESIRQKLGDKPFLGGETPLYADYVVFGGLQWAHCASPRTLLGEEDVIEQWRQRMLDLFGGHARAAPCSAAA